MAARKWGEAMPVISVMYPSANGATFDESYYMQSHIKLVRERWGPMGLSDITVLRGVPGPDGAAPTYSMSALLTFATMDQFKAAAAKHGKEIFADIPKFSTAQPLVQFNETVG